MIPTVLMPHEVTVVQPAAVVDSYGNTVDDYGPAATRTVVRAWLQQDQRTETFPDGRTPLDERWLLVTAHQTITGQDRIEWAGHPNGPVTFTVDGQPEPVYTPAGFHHTEARLRRVAG